MTKTEFNDPRQKGKEGLVLYFLLCMHDKEPQMRFITFKPVSLLFKLITERLGGVNVFAFVHIPHSLHKHWYSSQPGGSSWIFYSATQPHWI